MSSPTSLQVIALISGGKDSIFSLLHLQSLNHTIIALANLSPPSSSRPSSADDAPPSDLNSYMYQTAGAALVPHFSSLLGIPLYCQPITGKAVTTDKDYPHPHSKTREEKADEEDETEALIPLLRLVMSHHSKANALSSGAILSTYQRTRLESVALRLGLIPLAPLWQYPILPSPYPSPLKPLSLLLDMRAAGLKARMVKVASGGLGEGLLWEDLMDERVRKKVEQGVTRFGGGEDGAVLGEGGEFETVVTGGPWGEIEVEEEKRTVRTGEGGEAWIEIQDGAGRTRRTELESEKTRAGVREIGLWDEGWAEMAADATYEVIDTKKVAERGSVEMDKAHWSAIRSVTNGRTLMNVSNLTCLGLQGDVHAQMQQINTTIVSILKDHARSISDMVFTTILLRSMSDFAAVNAVYGTLFTKPNPPARVTIACGDTLPIGTDVIVSIVLDMQPREKTRGLHVQSRSYWAPANIGPYSQAISIPLTDHEAIIFVAGQIPLVPISMEILGTGQKMLAIEEEGDSFSRRAALSLQHLWRIGREMKVSWWTGSIAFLTGEGDCYRKALMAWNLWAKAHAKTNDTSSDDEEDPVGPDAWDMKYGGQGNYMTEVVEENVLPDFRALESLNDITRSTTPGFFAVQVDELPRGCDVEWQSIGLLSKSVRLQASLCRTGFSNQTCETVSGHFAMTFIEASISEKLDQSSIQRYMEDVTSNQISKNRDEQLIGGPHVTIYTPHPDVFTIEGAQIIPCRGIWGREGRELAAGIAVRWM